jgi:hypothetical protein
MTHPFVPQDAYSPSEQLVAALARAAHAAVGGDIEAAKTLKLIFGTSIAAEVVERLKAEKAA